MTITAPARTPADLGWPGRCRLPVLWDLATNPEARVTFGKVVLAYDLAKPGSDVRDEALVLFRALQERFEQQHGAIENSYFCTHVRGGCALVERIVGSGPDALVERRLHTVLNSPVTDLVTLEADCVLLADEANAALVRRAQLPALRAVSDAVYSAMTRVLAAADRWADPATPNEDRLAILATAKADYAAASQRVRATIQRHARFVYFQGTLLGALATMVLCVGVGVAAAAWWTAVVSTPALVASAVFGALGAVASVFQRISAGRLVLDYHTSPGQLVWLGSLRPLVGAVFGAVVQFALVGGLLGPAGEGRAPDAAFGLFVLIGFVSGFSERFATDMIERAGRVISGTGQTEPPAAAPAPAPPPATPEQKPAGPSG